MIKYKVISLFTGIGGMDMGFVKNIVVHTDSIIQKEFIEEYKNNNFIKLINNQFKIVFQNDISESSKTVSKYNDICYNYNTSNLEYLLKSNFIFPYSDVVIAGGVPCSDLFNNGFENSLFSYFIEVIKKVKPKVFVADNVPELFTDYFTHLINIIYKLELLKYDVEYQLIDCANFGIPQTRKRLIIIGISQKRKKQLLEKSWNIIIKNKTQCKISNYFKNLKEPNVSKDKLQKLYSKKQTQKTELELNLNTVSPTIVPYGNRFLIRYNQEDHARRLTIRESGLLQTFPPDFIFTKSKKFKEAYQHIGNAVPPLLGFLIADKINDLLTKYF